MLEVAFAGEKAEQQPLSVGQGDTETTDEPSLEPEVDTQASSTTTTEPAPPDKYKLVYFIMVLHGVGTLMPWNMFINAKDYFENYKLGPVFASSEDSQSYSSNFFTGLFWAAQLPNFIFSWVNVFCPVTGSVKRRIIITLSIEIFVCICTVALVPIKTSAHVFFWVTMILVATMNTCGGLYQNSVYGIGAKLAYMGPLVVGSNLSGVFTTLTSLVVLATATSQLTSAVFYFSTGTLIMILCLITYLFLPSLKFYQFYNPTVENLKDDASVAGDESIRNDMDTDEVEDKVDDNNNKYFRTCVPVLKQCWTQCYNVFMVFFVTLAVFPAVLSNVKVLSHDFVIQDPSYFVQVVCFLTFNLFAFFGNLLADWVQWPKPDHLWIAVTLRVIFIPFFLLCNFQPNGFVRSNTNVLIGDWAYWIGGVFLGLTNGYFSSLALMYCPRIVKSKDASVAGMLAAAFLVSGVFAGVNFSVIMPYIVARLE